MTKDERRALDAIHLLADADLFRIASPHAVDVMSAYGLRRAQIRLGLLDALECKLQQNGRYRLPTWMEGRHWDVVVEIEPEMVVVTLIVKEPSP